jgi:undecaprenyl-diphosphatase
VSTVISLCAQLLPFLAPIVLLLVWWWLPRERKARFAVLTILSGVAAVVLVTAAGALHADPRPFVVDPSRPPLFAHDPDNGFPSDHTAYSATAALLVTTVRRRLGLLLLLTSILGGLARVAANVHHLQDIVGALLIAVTAVGLALGVQLVTSASVLRERRS